MFDLGDLVPLSVEVRGADGELVNAATAALTITTPDGVANVVSVDNPPASTGVYLFDYIPDQAGIHRLSWVFTGPNVAFYDNFDVRDGARGILSLAAAKAHLNMSSSRDDDEIRSMIESVTAVIERHRAEVIAQRVVVEDSPSGSSGQIALIARPVISVTAIEDWSGATIPVDRYHLDGKNGILFAKAGGGGGRAPRRVTYLAGYAQIPANYIMAAKIILAHLWTTQRIQNIGAQPTLGNSSRREEQIVTPSGMGYAIPHRAIELLGGRPSMVI